MQRCAATHQLLMKSMFKVPSEGDTDTDNLKDLDLEFLTGGMENADPHTGNLDGTENGEPGGFDPILNVPQQPHHTPWPQAHSTGAHRIGRIQLSLDSWTDVTVDTDTPISSPPDTAKTGTRPRRQ